jgi:hypothetical protein
LQQFPYPTNILIILAIVSSFISRYRLYKKKTSYWISTLSVMWSHGPTIIGLCEANPLQLLIKTVDIHFRSKQKKMLPALSATMVKTTLAKWSYIYLLSLFLIINVSPHITVGWISSIIDWMQTLVLWLVILCIWPLSPKISFCLRLSYFRYVLYLVFLYCTVFLFWSKGGRKPFFQYYFLFKWHCAWNSMSRDETLCFKY